MKTERRYTLIESCEINFNNVPENLGGCLLLFNNYSKYNPASLILQLDREFDPQRYEPALRVYHQYILQDNCTSNNQKKDRIRKYLRKNSKKVEIGSGNQLKFSEVVFLFSWLGVLVLIT
jgi:hypothetical protein